MKKGVLITGGAGFIGSNFAHHLVNLNYNVTIVEKKEANLWRLEKIKDKIKICYLDLENYQQVEDFIIKLRPDIILHFAAYGAYPKKQKNISDTVTTNIMGTINLVNALSRIAFDCLISTGSSDEYGQKQKPIKETDILEPNSIYAITKVASTMYCKMMARKFDLPVIIVRLFMVYGYFEEKERLIPTIIRCCLTNNELKLSQPNSVRDFIFIEDAIDAYLYIIKNAADIKGEIFNLGSGRQTSIKEVVLLIKNFTKAKIEARYGQVVSAYQEPKNWVADISKMRKKLNWKPKYNLKMGLQKNIAWFKKNINLYT